MSNRIEPTPERLVWRDQWNDPLTENDRNFSAIDFTGDEGLTVQAPAEEQDINVIMKRFGVKDGSRLPYWTDPKAPYGDFSELPDNPVILAETLRQGELSFKALPADIRNRFGSGPQLYNWLQDENNHEEAVKMGLLKKVDPPRPQTPSVSSSTSSDKEELVPPPKKSAKPSKESDE